MDKITVKAPAKINLTLDVLGRRENGYHDLRMIMQTIDLCDEVTIEQITAEEITLSMNKELPDGCPMQKNLVYRAAILMKERYALPDGMNIILTKNIPAAAGLAGGSSDCAATLLGINELYNLDLSLDELCDICAFLHPQRNNVVGGHWRNTDSADSTSTNVDITDQTKYFR